VWANEVIRHFRTRADAQVPHRMPPSYLVPAGNWAPNAQFLDFPADDLLTGWIWENLTLTKDSANFETGTYSLLATKTAGGATSWMRAPLPINTVKGQTVTWDVRVRVPTGVTGNAGQLSL
jgi:hypothetical protein